MSYNNIEGLYCIIDSSWTGLEAAGECALDMAGAGARIIQLRAKGVPGAEVLKAAFEIREATRGKALFIVNDRCDVALLSGADGVHLGQDDIPLKEARRLMPEALIGISTHNIEEALKAQCEGADYVSYGPVFQTRTKKDADAVKGLAGLTALAAQIKIPVVAIGGITAESAPDVIAAGAASVAVISDILLSGDVKGRSAEIISRTAPVLEARRHGKQDRGPC